MNRFFINASCSGRGRKSIHYHRGGGGMERVRQSKKQKNKKTNETRGKKTTKLSSFPCMVKQARQYTNIGYRPRTRPCLVRWTHLPRRKRKSACLPTHLLLPSPDISANEVCKSLYFPFPFFLSLSLSYAEVVTRQR